MNGKTVSLICKISGILFSMTSIFLYVKLTGDKASAEVILSLAGSGIIIANMALPVDISKIIINLKGGKNE